VFVLAMAMSAFLTPLTLTVSVLAPLSLMAYAVGDYARGWRRVAGLGLLGLGLAGVLVATPAASRGSDGLVPTAIWVCLAVVAGAVAALHRDRAEQLQEVLRRIEADQQVELRVAVAEQREAIARDLHDSVAHAMTVVCLHAGAAQRLPGDEQVIRGSVDIIDTCVRGVLTELREGLDVLEPAGSVSAADLSREVGLIAQEMGLRLTVDVTGADFEVDEQTAGIARRVAREALVNVARHAPSSPAQVRISLSPAELEIEAVNALDHSGSSGGYALGSGSGLAGLDRLLQEHDGRLEYGETGAQQFRVAAYLPIATRVPA
jgi:signal transduction histidine kinase